MALVAERCPTPNRRERETSGIRRRKDDDDEVREQEWRAFDVYVSQAFNAVLGDILSKAPAGKYCLRQWGLGCKAWEGGVICGWQGDDGSGVQYWTEEPTGE